MNYCSIILLLAAVSTAQAVGNGQTTNHIKFTGLPGSFTYQRATSLQATGNGAQCSMGTVQAEGPLAPLTNEMHHIFRGPLNLKQFAVYQPKAAPVKRDTLRESPMERRGRLSHLEKHKVRNSHDHKQEKRNYGEWVTATIDGQVVSFIDNWSPHSTPITQPTSASPATITPAAAPAPIAAIQKGPVRVAAAPGPGPDNGSAKPQTLDTTDEWVRVSYFDSNSKTTDNIAFTANNNFAMGFGFMQGYVASNGVDASTTPQALNGFIPDNYEVIISSAQSCSGSDNSGGCAVTCPGSTAHHGFGGDRVVIMEYTMPESQCASCPNKYTGNNANTNLPAIWALGSDLVNIAQYGLGPNGECSGWTSGAGEFDIHEILPGDVTKNIGYASFHMGQHYSGTPAEGFPRPTDANRTQKLAYVLSGNYAGIHILGNNFPIDGGLSSEDVLALITGSNGSAGPKSPVKTSIKLANSGAPAYSVDVQSTSFAALLSS